MVLEGGRRVDIPWEILRTVTATENLIAGQSVVVGFDHTGEVKSLRLAREESA